MNEAWRQFLSGLGLAVSSPSFALSIVVALVVVIAYHWTVVRPRQGRAARTGAAAPDRASPADASDLRSRIAALGAASQGALQHVGFVRFNAFPDVASDLSYALAVLDARGDGFVVSSLYSREEVRTYAKRVAAFAADKEVSGEERRAIEMARERSRQHARS